MALTADITLIVFGKDYSDITTSPIFTSQQTIPCASSDQKPTVEAAPASRGTSRMQSNV